MIDVKKLITGFLILAVAAVASGVILSLVGNFTATAQTPITPSVAGVGAGTAIAANAFVDTGSIKGNAAEVLAATDTSSTKVAATDPTNLTNAFADSFVNGLSAANPAGIATDASGTPIFNAPDTQSMAAEISSNPAVKNFKAPAWNVDNNDQLIKVTSSTSPTDITQYANSLNSIFNKYFVSTELQNSLNAQTGDPSTLTYVGGQVQGALSDTLALSVPAPLVGFQKSLIKVMAFEENSAQLGDLAATDPVKASLILENEQAQYTSAIADLQKQMKSASTVGLLFGKDSPVDSTPFIAKILGVQEAHALFGVGDISFDPATFGELVLTYANDAVVQILKNTLVSLIQRKVLTWIQGSGAPKFVTDWGSELVNSFQTAALNRLNNDIACVPVGEQHLLKVMLSTPPIGQGNLNNSCAAEFQSQLGNGLATNQLFNQFTNFNDFLTVIGGANVWANIIKIQDDALAAGANSQNASQVQNIAQQGWNGSQVCADGSDPNGTHSWCNGGVDPHTVEVCDDGSTAVNGFCADGSGTTATLQCNDGSAPEVDPNAGKCADGTDPKVTSPGQVTGQSMFTVLKGGVENITSATSIVGILNSLLSSLLNTLAQSAINYANQGVNGALTDSGVSGIKPSTITSTPPSTPLTNAQCLPSIQNSVLSTTTFQAVATVYAGGGAIDSVCASGGFCPATENPDGSPIYNWDAQGSTLAQAGNAIIGTPIQLTYTAPGVYYATVTASTDNTTSSCEIDVQ